MLPGADTFILTFSECRVSSKEWDTHDNSVLKERCIASSMVFELWAQSTLDFSIRQGFPPSFTQFCPVFHTPSRVVYVAFDKTDS